MPFFVAFIATHQLHQHIIIILVTAMFISISNTSNRHSQYIIYKKKKKKALQALISVWHWLSSTRENEVLSLYS